jgi:hypoxanthine phosphoribosyltransferase
MLAPAQAWKILNSADCLYSADAVTQAVQRIAAQITSQLAQANPLVLCVMSGAAVFAGHLLPQLRFPLEFDYLHATRYAGATRGGQLEWKVFPHAAVAGRTVLIVDDILDEGHTMSEIRARAMAAGAQRFYSAVLAEKELGAPKAIVADFVGLKLPNRYVFGYGMDVEGAWRNLPDIYALKQD